MRRRELLRVLGGAPFLAADPAFSATAKRPNVLFVVIDDLNKDLDNGLAPIHASHYARLARRGVRFERAYCQCPLCNPSRVSLLSGLYPTTTQVLDNITPPRYTLRDYVTLPQYLRAHGYRTAYAGKISHLADPASWEENLPPPATEKAKSFNYWMDPVGPRNADIADNTVVVIICDNGFHLGQKGMWAKMTLFESSARVPLIIADPRKNSGGSACPAMVELVDLYPTLVELCGRAAPPPLEGQSLVRFLDDPQGTWEREAFTVMLRHGKLAKSIRTVRWRFTEWDEGRRGTELYDHDRDPNEMRNLASRREYAATVADLKRRLRALRL